VIRRLCGFMGAEAVFTELAGALQEEADLTFVATMVQVCVCVCVRAPAFVHMRVCVRACIFVHMHVCACT